MRFSTASNGWSSRRWHTLIHKVMQFYSNDDDHKKCGNKFRALLTHVLQGVAGATIGGHNCEASANLIECAVVLSLVLEALMIVNSKHNQNAKAVQQNFHMVCDFCPVQNSTTTLKYEKLTAPETTSFAARTTSQN
jgi:hypothetical protein